MRGAIIALAILTLALGAPRSATEDDLPTAHKMYGRKAGGDIPPSSHVLSIAEYEDADRIWKFLKEKGFSDACTAGILGNIMTECGGCTMKLQPTIYGQGFYGICQWSGYYFPEIQGAELGEQLDFLMDTLESQLGDRLESFLSAETPESAALIFAVWYERCAEWGYGVRQECARAAYNYFGGMNDA